MSARHGHAKATEPEIKWLGGEVSEARCPKAKDGEEHALVGVEVQGVYDGVLFWQCEVDGELIHRWPEGHYLRGKTDRVWREWHSAYGMPPIRARRSADAMSGAQVKEGMDGTL